MTEHFFLNPFALAGDKSAIPEDEQVDGSVSYEKGFTVDYQLDQSSDPDAKNIPRQKFNSLMFVITEALRQLQTVSVPSFITSAANGGTPWTYKKGVRVEFENPATVFKIYQSKVDANTTDPTNTTNWEEVTSTITIPDASESVKGILELATAAEAIGGSDTTRAVTSAGLAAFKNLAQNGYMRLPGGFIMQWGRVTTGSSGALPITFPIAFPTQCFGITGSVNQNNTNNQDVGFGNVSTTGATAYLADANVRPIFYWAFGS